MGLEFYDSTKTLMSSTDVLRTQHDGWGGGIDEKLIYVRNDDATRYFTNLVLSLSILGDEDLGEFGTTGWSIKFMTGERRPTEAEWDLVRSGDSVNIADIGSTASADTSTYRPVWVRVYCPGGQRAQLRENQDVLLSGYERLVGA